MQTPSSNSPRHVARLGRLVRELRSIIGKERLISSESEVVVYECDGFVIERNTPDIVAFPETTEEVAAIVKACVKAEVPFLPRGAGTSLAGGCLPVGGGVMIALTRMRAILDISLRDRFAIVEPGVVNLHLTNALAGTGFHFAPDPSSQGACTIGGNIATNAGGPHTLKYGVTSNHVLAIEVVTSTGDVVQVGTLVDDPLALDLVGPMVGSEGTLGIVTKAWVRIVPNPSSQRTFLTTFNSISDATQAISDIISAGIVPAALEMLDHGILVAVEEAFHIGFPLDAGAVLLIEIDGIEAGLEATSKRIESICKKNCATQTRYAKDSKERARLWLARKKAFGAIGRLSPSFCTQDGVVPRTKLPQIMEVIRQCEEKYDLRIVNVLHAGDGNIHPILLFDERDASQVQRVLAASHAILSACLELGGSVTGEHGIGVEKIEMMKEMFTVNDLDVMQRLRDALNPGGLLSVGKVLPTAGACSLEQKHPSRQAAV